MNSRLYLLIIYCTILVNIPLCNSYGIIYKTSSDPGYKFVSVSPSELDIKYFSSKDFGDVYKIHEETDTNDEVPIESHSTGSYYVGSQGPAITIEKYTNNFKDIYRKNENITIKIKIINSNKQNRLEDVHIFEEIPEGFEFIEANPVNITNRKRPNTIMWDCGSEIRSSRTYEFTLRTNKSGKHNFGSTMLEATVVDKNGRKNEVIVNSNRLINIIILNEPPKFSDLNPDPPINIRRTLIGNKPAGVKNINVRLTDPDNDTITCELLSSSGCKPLNATNITSNKVKGIIYYTYSWDISGFESGTHILTLDAFDGYEHKLSQDIKLNVYKIPPDIKTSFGGILIIVIAGLIIKHYLIFSNIKYRLGRNWMVRFMLCYIRHEFFRGLIVSKLEKNRTICVFNENQKNIKYKAINYTELHSSSNDSESDNKNIMKNFDSVDTLPPQEPKKKKEDESDISDHDLSSERADDS